MAAILTECLKRGVLVACSFQRRSYYRERRRGSSRGRVGSLGSETRLANCPRPRKTLSYSHRRPTHSSLRHDRKQPRETESVPDRQCPTAMVYISTGMRTRLCCSIRTDLHCD